MNKKSAEKDFLWRECLDKALKKNRRDPSSRYFQFATIKPNGKPANRTVVFRGFGEQDEIYIISDSRSQKVSELKQSNEAEICWYFSGTRQQFRIAGKAEWETDARSEVVRKLWQKISEPAKSQFYWPAPGREIEESATEKDTEIDDSSPPRVFGVLRFIPNRVDYLSLRGNPQTRIVSCLEKNEWVSTRINP